MSNITKTPLCLKVTCKCGACIGASMIYGGLKIGKEFTDLIAENHLNGGETTIVNADETPVQFSKCICASNPSRGSEPLKGEIGKEVEDA